MQAAKLVINLFGVTFILCVLEKSPLVLSPVWVQQQPSFYSYFDAIWVVAGFQLSVNNMVAVGDWIEMPNRGADGDVIDVSLTTVKVQNWDKTLRPSPPTR